MDFEAIRAAQHQHWDGAAVGWNERSAFNDRADRHISERLVELAGVRPGSRVLDVAAGYGEPALTAAGGSARTAASWPRTSPPRCSRTVGHARRG